MSTKYKMHGVNHILTKGALDSILDRCVSIATKDGIRPITDEDKAEISRVNREYSEQGLRVLTFAYKESDEALTVDTENDYTFIGLVSMIDPPREESKQAVADAIRAGIKPVMITGDHKITASAIAKQIGIFNDGGQWGAAGDAVHQAAQKPGLVRLLPGGGGGIPTRGPALEKAVQLLQVHPLPGGQAVHRHADGRGVGLAENGHMQIFTQI